MDELAPKVTVGEWINIDNFSLTGAPRTYRTTKNPKKMNFLHNTDISESTLQIEDDFLDLVDFDTILSGKPDDVKSLTQYRIKSLYSLLHDISSL